MGVSIAITSICLSMCLFCAVYVNNLCMHLFFPEKYLLALIFSDYGKDNL